MATSRETSTFEAWLIFLLIIVFLVKFALLYYYWIKRKQYHARLHSLEQNRTRRDAQIARDREMAELHAADLFRQMSGAPPSYQQVFSEATTSSGGFTTTRTTTAVTQPSEPPPDYSAISVITPPPPSANNEVMPTSGNGNGGCHHFEEIHLGNDAEPLIRGQREEVSLSYRVFHRSGATRSFNQSDNSVGIRRTNQNEANSANNNLSAQAPPTYQSLFLDHNNNA